MSSTINTKICIYVKIDFHVSYQKVRFKQESAIYSLKTRFIHLFLYKNVHSNREGGEITTQFFSSSFSSWKVREGRMNLLVPATLFLVNVKRNGFASDFLSSSSRPGWKGNVGSFLSLKRRVEIFSFPVPSDVDRSSPIFFINLNICNKRWHAWKERFCFVLPDWVFRRKR